MKKKFLSGTFAFALIATAGWGVQKSMSSNSNLNDLALANVEALAENEGSDCHYTNGWTAFSGKSGGGYDCCQIWVSKAPDQGAGHCR